MSKAIILNLELDSKSKSFKYSTFNCVSNLNFYTFDNYEFSEIVKFNIEEMKKEIKHFLKIHNNEFEMLTFTIYESNDYKRHIQKSARLVNRYSEKRFGIFNFESQSYVFDEEKKDYDLESIISEYINMYCLYSLKLVNVK
jgi:hypothetical protein